MDNNTRKMINGFVRDLNASFKFIKTEVSEVPYDDSILIYHNYKDCNEDKAFLASCFKLYNKYFYENDISNVGVSYSYELDQKIKKREGTGIEYFGGENYRNETASNPIFSQDKWEYGKIVYGSHKGTYMDESIIFESRDLTAA